MTEEQLETAFPPHIKRMVDKLPVIFDWVEFKGEVVFAAFNYERTEKATRPMFDISYCATRAINGVVLYTVQWDKSKFKPSRLGTEWKII